MTFKGFQYGKDKQMDTKIYWKCDDRACKGRVVTSSGEPVIILKETPHNLHGQLLRVRMRCTIKCQIVLLNSFPFFGDP